LSKSELLEIRDDRVRKIVTDAAAARGGEPKKAFPPYPRVSECGPEIRKVRLLSKQQLKLMAPVSTGYADLGSNHHVAIYSLPSGKAVFEVVSLIEVARRLSKREPAVRRIHDSGAKFLMSLSQGDSIRFAKEPGNPATTWYVQKIASKGQISLLSLNDASPEEQSLFEPMVGGIVSRNAEKLSIDPIGRVRVAND
jgi:hypothetical protein